MLCPACGKPVEEAASECRHCGVIPSRWRGSERKPPRPSPTVPASPPVPKSPPRLSISILRPVAIGLVLTVAIVGGWWWVEIRPRMKRIEDPYWGSGPSRASTLSFERSSAPFDRSVELPCPPIGIAFNGSEMLVANRSDPWGFLRIVPEGRDELRVQKVSVVEPEYSQKVGFDAVTWNGSTWVGLSQTGAFTGGETGSFTIHDPKTLRVTETHAAPPDIGCFAWDGTGYWAATRNNTADSGEPRRLHRLDSRFRVERTVTSPLVGCQGMAWDGTHLLMVDVFDDDIVIVDVANDEPRVVRREDTGLEYLSGIADANGEIWVAEYGGNRLHRVAPRLAGMWRGSGPSSVGSGAFAASMIPSPSAREAGQGEIAELQGQLRADHWAERMRAGSRLEELGAPVNYDREQNSFPDTGAEDVDVLDWWAEFDGDSIRASWRVHFGDQLISSRSETTDGPVSMPLFARYEVSVSGGDLDEPIELEYEGHAGENRMDDVLLARGLSPGSYTIGLFFHVQYVRPDGTPHILNHSMAPLTVER